MGKPGIHEQCEEPGMAPEMKTGKSQGIDACAVVEIHEDGLGGVFGQSLTWQRQGNEKARPGAVATQLGGRT